MRKIDILNLQINNISQDESLQKVTELAKKRESSYVCFTNAHMTVEANRDKYILNIVNTATLALPDGGPVAKAFKLIHGIKQERIAGMDFFPLMLKECNKHNLKVGLIGSTDEVLDKIHSKIKKELPQIEVTQIISPPFKQEWDNEAYINSFNASNTNIVFVALGCPLQEKWMFEYYKKINAVLLGVGGAFPVYAGEVSRAPKWMSNNSLEWLYRLIKEPKRMWKRYFYTNTVFLKLLIQRLIIK
jgi:N-acetylglucosaminyldiphosphoundecaprenol N-acetyl-beta-D-mannosaminyltransferase